MIVALPGYTPIDLDILAEFRSLTSIFPPYAEFNFVNLMSWNRGNRGKVSLLNGNLVLSFPAYGEDSQFISFIGQQQLSATVATLLDYAAAELSQCQLDMVPAMAARPDGPAAWCATGDVDNPHYVISLPNLIPREPP